jgi:hypothetical protein
MSIRVKQVMTAILAASAALVGGWATFAPRSWYDDFPWPGRHWVSGVGPYNEHLVRDVGGLYLALFVVSVCAVLSASSHLLRLTGGAWLAFSLPHLLFHLHHLDGYRTIDKVANVVALGGTLLLAILLLLPTSASTSRRATG